MRPHMLNIMGWSLDAIVNEKSVHEIMLHYPISLLHMELQD
jgi:hypothetical protein